MSILSSTACRPAPEPPRYTTLAASAVGAIALQELSDTRLGDGARGSVHRITEAATSGSRIAILDADQGKIGVFDFRGRPVAHFGALGFKPDEFQAPRDIALLGDTVYVLDARRRGKLMRFLATGAYQGTETITDRSIGSLGNDGTRLLVNPLPREDSVTESRKVLLANSQGTVEGHGCESLPQADQTRAKQNSILRMYVFGDVAARGDTIICSQPLLPVLQWVVVRGGATVDSGRVEVAPPFYRAPPDRKRTTSMREVMRFASTWTAPSRVFATNGGFLSVYVTYDTLTEAHKYFLFHCKLGRDVGTRCAQAPSPGRVIAFRDPDSLFVEAPAVRDSAPHLRVYRVGL